MTIADMQRAILDLGYQFEEHVYNDGMASDCSIRISSSKSPHAFSYGSRDPEDGKKEVGWGRFSRLHAWRQAYDCLVLKRRSPESM